MVINISIVTEIGFNTEAHKRPGYIWVLVNYCLSWIILLFAFVACWIHPLLFYIMMLTLLLLFKGHTICRTFSINVSAVVVQCITVGSSKNGRKRGGVVMVVYWLDADKCSDLGIGFLWCDYWISILKDVLAGIGSSDGRLALIYDD